MELLLQQSPSTEELYKEDMAAAKKLDCIHVEFYSTENLVE